MTDQEWQQASDGQWYPVNRPTSQLSATTKWILAGAGLLMVVVFVFGLVQSGYGTDEPVELDARDMVWADMTTSERVRFCAEARAAGYQVVASEMSDGTREDQREARYWLEDRCG